MASLTVQKTKSIGLRIIRLLIQYKYVFLLLPAFFLRDYTPDNELKYISIAAEALKNHTWFTFFNHGEIYADKPPLYFWIIMLGKLITGGYNMWFAGLFSLLPAAGIMIVMDKWCAKWDTAHNPTLSNLLLLTTTMFLASAIVVRMDMLMTFFIVLSLHTFYKLYKNAATPTDKYLLPVYLFLGIFTKGAMGILIPLISITAFLLAKKKIHSFGHYLGWRQWGIIVGLCLIWFFMVFFEEGSAYLYNLIFKQTFGRAFNSFHHKQPFWFYFPRMLWSFAPWILLYLVLIVQAIRKKLFQTELQQFFGIITAANIIMLSLISSKLDIYLLPVYPFAVYLCAALLPAQKNNPVVKIAIGIPASILILALPAFITFREILPPECDGIWIYTGLSLLSASGIIALATVIRNPSKAITYMAYGILLMYFTGSFAIPRFNSIIGFNKLAQTALQAGKKQHVEKYFYYKSGSAADMDVLLGQRLYELDSIQQLDSLNRLPEASIVFVKSKELSRESELREWLSSKTESWKSSTYNWYLLGNG